MTRGGWDYSPPASRVCVSDAKAKLATIERHESPDKVGAAKAMIFALFEPQLTRDDAFAFASRYPAKDDESALEAGHRIKSGDCSRAHLKTIYRWKTNDRGRSRLERNTDAQIEDALWLAVVAKEPRSAIAVLTGLYGIDTPVASAIATVIYPSRYTILDFRALEALGTPKSDNSLPFYLEYLTFCIALAAEWRMSLRQLDRGLWQWSAAQSPRRKDTP